MTIQLQQLQMTDYCSATTTTDNTCQSVRCGQRQPPLSGGPIPQNGCQLHEREMETWTHPQVGQSSGIPPLRGICPSPYRQNVTGSLHQQQQQLLLLLIIIIIIIRSSLLGQWHATRTCPSLVSSTPL